MNPVALVTGASRGIGRGIALQLAAAGWDLVLNFATNEGAARQTAADCREAALPKGVSIRAEPVRADISQGADRTRLLEDTRRLFGRLDLLVNNAGVAPAVRADLLEESEEQFDHLLDVNLKGAFFLTQAAVPWLIEQRQLLSSAPRIVFISSVSANTASVNRGSYCLAKAALSMACQLFAVRLAADDIPVYEIRPGIIETDMTRPVKQKYDALIEGGLTPMPRWGTPKDVGQAVVAIAQGLLPYSTGQIIQVDGGLHLRRL